LRSLSLFVFIDALGWKILSRQSFLDDILQHKQPLNTVFGYSSTCDPTIITGLDPQEHGHFSFFYFDPENSPFWWARYLGILPRSLTSRGRVRHWISKISGKLLGYSGYFQLYNMPFSKLHYFNYSEKKDIYRQGGINSGADSVFVHLDNKGVPFHLSNWRRGEEQNLASLKEAMSAPEKPSLAYLYLAAMDAILHADGTESKRVEEKMKWYDRQLRSVLEEANKNYSNVRLFIFSDHGMTNVTSTLDLIPKVEALGYKFGQDYAAVYDSTMARFWFRNSAAETDVRTLLEGVPGGRVLGDEHLAAYGCLFPDQKYGQLFYLLDPGVLLCPSFMGEKPLAGMHGYDPHHEDSVASFSTNTEVTWLRDLKDLYRLMRAEAEA
jgi:type I phosphodiesterase/nucleotide pyrophosphatase